MEESKFGNSYNRTTIADDPNTEEYDMNKRDEGFDEGDGFSPDKGDDSHHMERDQGQNMVEYEELEAEILRTCKETGTLWEDKDFPASQTSLYNNIANVPDELREFKTIKWIRPHDITKEACISLEPKPGGDVKQGAVGNCWFLGALVQISTKPDYLERLFVDVSEEHFKMGFVCIQFFKNGEWKQIFIDTLLPFDPESKQLLFGQCGDSREFWVPLVEKAYAKLHGSYENILKGKMTEVLVDLTGGVCEKWDFRHEITKELNDKEEFWTLLQTCFKEKFILGCVNNVKGKKSLMKNPKNLEFGPHGILENHAYGILDIREFPLEKLQLIRIRNPWGQDGAWNGPFSDDSEEWDKYRNLRDELKLVFKSQKSDGTWWMSFQHFWEFMNKLYVCKVFPEDWKTFAIDSEWRGKTAGGPCPNLDKNATMKNVQADTDDKWFNNPQFRIKVREETKLYISLLQADKINSGINYVPVNFMVVVNRDTSNRIWERPPNKEILVDTSKSAIRTEGREIREITQQVNLSRFEGKKYGSYIIIPNNETENKKEEQRPFWIRIFASKDIDVSEVAETKDKVMDGAWSDTTAGGRKKERIEVKEGKDNKEVIEHYVDNPHWCLNSQYFLNLSEPTHFKIILRKTGGYRKTRNVPLGLCICRYEDYVVPNNVNINNATANASTMNNRTGSPKELSNTKKKFEGTLKKTVTSAVTKLMTSTIQHLEPPVMEKISRKLAILPGEKYIESSFCSDEVAALYFHKNPTEGPFIIVPCLEKKELNATYRLTIHSNKLVDLQKLDESNNAVLIGRWQSPNNGGCHLFEAPFESSTNRTWTQNPKYLLQFKDTTGSAKIKVTLRIAEKNWKAKIAKDFNKSTVGGMIGIYVINKKEGKIQTDDIVAQSPFVPMMEVSVVFNNVCSSSANISILLIKELTCTEINKNGYIIMPTTYESRIDGRFILAVSSDREITFQLQ